MVSEKRRIWGWMFFDWAQQPYFTLGLTFVFGPYFGEVAANLFMSEGLAKEAADAQAQSLWTGAQTVAGLIIALTAPFVGAWADAMGRKLPWIAVFSTVYILCAAALWMLMPDGTGLYLSLVIFSVGFIAAESAINLNNAILPSLGDQKTVGRLSGSGAAFGYWGGVLALALMLLLLAENADGVTLLGNAPILGLDAAAREGTRSVGPFIAIWCLVFMIPFFLWVREPAAITRKRVRFAEVTRDLNRTLRGVIKRRSLASFLVSSMLYRDAMGAIYLVGGLYANRILGWSIIEIGIFGVVGAITAAIITWAGGLADARFGPKPVILASIWVLIGVTMFIAGMSRTHLFGVPLAEGSALPDIIFYICGAAIGGAGGSIYSASRTMMIRHADPDRPGEAFGLFALSGRATAFLAPALVTLVTTLTGSAQLGVTPVIALFLIGLFLLRYVDKNGDRAEWSAQSPQSP